jgi:hypothetical protein
MTIPEQQIQNQQNTNDKEFNFGQLRKQLEQERAARMQLEAQIANQFESMKSQANNNYSKMDEDPDDDAPYIDRKTLNKVIARTLDDVDKKIDRKAEEKARILMEQERQNNYLKQNPDFNEILSAENIKKFADKHPELAEDLVEQPEGFKRQLALYKQIKALGIHRPPEPPKPSIQDTINKNRRSPYYQPSASAGAPPYEAVGDFSQSGQKNAYQKMQELINNRKSL